MEHSVQTTGATSPLAVTQFVPRFDAGVGLSSIEGSPPRIVVASDLNERTATLALRSKKQNVIVFSNRTVCVTTSFNSAPVPTVSGYCQDANGGLSEINVLSAENCTVTIDGFPDQTTGSVNFTVAKVVGSLPSNWRIEALSADGTKTETYFEM
jgi:hypothetical protein